MTIKRAVMAYGCIIPDETDGCDDDLYTSGARIIINGPPKDSKCEICRRHVSELGDFNRPGIKLRKQFREMFPGYPKASWECRDCVGRPGGLWEFDEEEKLGRELTKSESFRLRRRLEDEMWKISNKAD